MLLTQIASVFNIVCLVIFFLALRLKITGLEKANAKRAIASEKLLQERVTEDDKLALERHTLLVSRIEKIEIHVGNMTAQLAATLRQVGVKEGVEQERARSNEEKDTAVKAVSSERDRVELLRQKAPTLIVNDGKVIVDNEAKTPVVVDSKVKQRIIADEDKNKED